MALDCWFPSPRPPRARSSQIPFLKDNNARDYDAFYSSGTNRVLECGRVNDGVRVKDD